MSSEKVVAWVIEYEMRRGTGRMDLHLPKLCCYNESHLVFPSVEVDLVHFVWCIFIFLQVPGISNTFDEVRHLATLGIANTDEW